MNGNLMDTNVIVRVLNGDRELMYGAAKSAHVVQNKQNARVFARAIRFSEFPIS